MTDIRNESTPEGTAPSGGASQRQIKVALFILTIVYAFNFIDRQILVIMQEAIKVDLGLSDTQLGILSGFSFAIFYVTAGLPIARYADRANRRNIVATALAVWSSMTAISGLVQNYWQLVLARIGVGIGEAGGSPPSHSMISDMYPPEKRATALAIYSSGLYLGVLLGYLIGGYFSDVYGWRMTFFLVGIPGVLLAIVVRFAIKEPIRGQFDEGVALKERPSFLQTLKFLMTLKSFPYFAFGCAMSAFVSYGVGNFMPSFMIRYHGFSPTEVGFILSATNGLAGMIGTFLGGWAADRLSKYDVRWYMWFPAITGGLAIPVGVFAYNTDNSTLMIALAFFQLVLSATYLAPAIAMSHRLSGPVMRAMASAVLFFILNLIGLGLGPVVVGALSDIIREITGNESLREALTITVMIALVKVFLFYKAGKNLNADLEAGQK
ncbi:MFS transporter [Kordiimonas sediminis]|uniref:MFS transporter n=1 Tax=Kordiimonas sediminis TaxID=1735581 RepID=A0A919AZM8_9PROT|nr:MFS transporter [Kordiimonas sediminis]GHF30366.1 MFS transporter [Kordiimonas sediminis]